MEWRKSLVLLALGAIGTVGAQAPAPSEVKRQAISVEKANTSRRSDERPNTGFEFMGIFVGGRLVRECPVEQLYGGAIYDLSSLETACWATSNMRQGPRPNLRNNDALTVVPVSKKRPTGTRTVTAVVVDGRIEGLRVETDGFQHAQQLFEQLQQKLGKPTIQGTSDVVSGVGAKFSSPEAVWNLPNVYVHFSGIVGAVDSGLILVYTPEQQAREAARQKAQTKSF